MKIEYTQITPRAAKEMLKKNRCNRNIIAAHVDFLSKEMTNGDFKPTHQGLAVNQDGYLLDGQHRLLAVIKSNVTITTPVAVLDYDSPLDAPIDFSSKQRTVADITGLHKQMVEVANAIYRLAHSYDGKATISDLVKISKYVNSIDGFLTKGKASVRAAFILATRKYKNDNMPDYQKMYSEFVTGGNLPLPVLAVRKKISIRGIDVSANALIDNGHVGGAGSSMKILGVLLEALDPGCDWEKIPLNISPAMKNSRDFCKTILN